MSDRQDGVPPPTTEQAWDATLRIGSDTDTILTGLDTISDDELDDYARALEENARKIARAQAAVAGRIAEAGLPKARGYASAAGYLRDTLRITRGEANSRLRAAERFHPRLTLTGQGVPAQFPLVAAAQAAGGVSGEHGQVITGCLERLPVAVPVEARVQVEQVLVELAGQFDPTTLRRCAQKIALTLDPDGLLAEDREKRQQRGLSITKTSHGMYKLFGFLDPESANIVLTALAPLRKPANTRDIKDDRSSEQLNADALVTVCSWAMSDPEMPEHGLRRPQVVITTTLDELLTKTGRATINNGDLVPIETMIRELQDAEASLAIFGAEGETLWFGQSQRTAPLGLRRALEARDKGCIRPGCEIGGEHCQVMHAPDWRFGGTTDPEHNALACLFHHIEYDDPDSGWQLLMINGVPHTIAPPWIDPTQTPRRNHAHDPPSKPPEYAA